jgi:hypothetical protein
MADTPSARLVDIARSMSCPLDESLEPWAMVGVIAGHLESRPFLWRDGFQRINDVLPDLLDDGLPSWQDLDALARYLRIFDLLPVYDLPLQPNRGTEVYHNGPARWWVTDHHLLLRLFMRAHKGLARQSGEQDDSSSISEPERGLAYPEEPSPASWWRWLDSHFESAVLRFESWINEGQDDLQADVGGKICELAFNFFRTGLHLDREVRGSSVWIDPDEIRFVVEELLPRVGPEYVPAAAEALNLLIEISATRLADPVARGESVAAPRNEAVARVLHQALQLEQELWTRIGHRGRAVAAASFRVWLESHYQAFDAGAAIGTLIGQPAPAAREIQAACLESPMLAVTLMTILSDRRFASLPALEAAGTSVEQMFLNAAQPLLHDVGNPAKLPCRIRYRSVVRAILLGAPPIVAWIEHLLIASAEQRAFDTLQALWRANARIISTWHGGPVEDVPGFREWLAELRVKAFELLATYDTPGQVDGALAEITAVLVPGSIAAADTPAQMLYRDLQSRYLRYFRIRPAAAPTPTFTDTIARAAELGADVLVMFASAHGVVLSHRSAATGQWDHARAIQEISRLALSVALGIANLPEARSDQALAAVATDTGGLSGQALVWQLTRHLVEPCRDRFTFGPRLCVVLSPELRALPILSQLALALGEQHGDEAAVGELRVELGAPAAALNAVRPSYRAFVDESLSDTEVIWHELRLPGTTASSFTAAQVRAALADGTPLVHLVTHGVLDEDAPVFSCVRAGAEPLFAFEIGLTPVRTRLLVLNTCSSAAGGQYFSGSGFSPADCALVAGASAVVANLQPVETTLATRFGVALQRRLATPGTSLAQAFIAGVRQTEVPTVDMPSFVVASSSIDALFRPDWVDDIVPRATHE